MYCFFVFKQKTAYEMRISDWSSDVCSSDLGGQERPAQGVAERVAEARLQGLDHEPRAVVGDDLFGQGGALCDEHWGFLRSEQRRAGKECFSTFRSRWSPNL